MPVQKQRHKEERPVFSRPHIKNQTKAEMYSLINRLNRTDSVSVDSLGDPGLCGSSRDLVVSPQLTEHLQRIAQQAGVIRAASQFADSLPTNGDENFAHTSQQLDQRGCHMLDTLETHLSVAALKQCPINEVSIYDLGERKS
ncbi:hypothetical protein FBUS_03713 [Fasciolopsis buskii]|uniref:Uncharacterized protein n=1 Tax=Fasciolopsis buskii TaxID=27845 RepID=A0A8E0RZ80_9TREM|nr:hypothetical protein FBUS_03713 [Fasciolopsis buski]